MNQSNQAARLGWGIIWRMIAYGVWLGVVSGGLLAAILTTGALGSGASVWLEFALVGALTGGVIGLALGLILGAGLVWAISGSLRSSSSVEQPVSGSYLRTFVRIVSVGYILLGFIAIGILLDLQPQDVGTYAAATCIPLIIATGGAWWAGNRVITWLEEQLDRPRELDVP